MSGPYFFVGTENASGGTLHGKGWSGQEYVLNSAGFNRDSDDPVEVPAGVLETMSDSEIRRMVAIGAFLTAEQLAEVRAKWNLADVGPTTVEMARTRLRLKRADFFSDEHKGIVDAGWVEA